jgi:MATE family multidrug resistance protein
MAKTLLLVVAFYSFFDGVFLVYSGVLKGAGDTKFVMFMAMFFSILVLTVPSVVLTLYRAQMVPRTGLLLAWGLCANYIVMLAFANLLRYRIGRWRGINMVG